MGGAKNCRGIGLMGACRVTVARIGRRATRALGVGVVGLMLLLWTGAPASASSAARPVRHFSPHFTRLATASEVIVAGDYRLLLSQRVARPEGWRVVDVTTGRAEVFDPPVAWECAFAGMGPTAILFNCLTGPGSTIAYNLATGSMSVFSTFSASLFSSTIGARWVAFAYATDPTDEHTTTSYRFANLLTGQIVADPRRIRGSTYINLDSPQLAQTACAPITVPAELDADVAYVPGDLEFFGRVGVRIYDVHDQQVIGIQHCGSRHIQHYSTPGLVSNKRLLLWMFHNGRGLQGLTEPQGQQFAIPIPKTLTRQPIDSVTITDHTIYITTGVQEDIWTATLPAALR